MIPCGVSAPQNATHMTTALAKEFIKLDLELLGTDYVDLLLVHHRCNSPEETKALWLALEAALTSGVAKASRTLTPTTSGCWRPLPSRQVP